MKRTILALAVLVIALAPLGFSQFAPQQHPHRNLGYYDPATGSFTPIPPVEDAEAPATTPTTGTLTFNFTLTVKSTIPKNAVIGCTSAASVFDSGSGITADETVSGVAKLVSGTTYSCSLVIHYSWVLTSPTTDKISLNHSASIEYGYQATATNGTGTIVVPVIDRSSAHSVASITVPANGATTTTAVAITL